MNLPGDTNGARGSGAKTNQQNDTLASSEIVQLIVEGYRFVSGTTLVIIDAARRFLERGRPASTLIAAFVLYMVAVLLIQMSPLWFSDAIKAQEAGYRGLQQYESAIRMMHFVLFVASMARIAAIMLGAWALVRLIADAFKSEKTNA
ncbi:MAG: hypothetical protein WD114_05820 [Phycisphaerales bacterium]